MKAHGFSGDITDISMHKTSGGCCSATSMTPLHLAAQRGEHEMVELMIKTGAKVDELDGKRRKPEAVAQRCNKSGPHDAVLQKLKDPLLREQAARRPRSVTRRPRRQRRGTDTSSWARKGWTYGSPPTLWRQSAA